MKELLEKLQEVGDKAQYLHQRSTTLGEENRVLRRRIAELEGAIAQKDTETREISQQLEIAKLAKGMGAGDLASNEMFKDKINEYIREIDQCLKLIGD